VGRVHQRSHIAQYDSFLIAGALLWLGCFGPSGGAAWRLQRSFWSLWAGAAGFSCSAISIYRLLHSKVRLPSLRTTRDAQNILMYYARLPQLSALASRISPACHVATNLYTIMAPRLARMRMTVDQEALVALDRLYMEILNDAAKSPPRL
jgi:hypothetical protein